MGRAVRGTVKGGCPCANASATGFFGEQKLNQAFLLYILIKDT
jgi:hypothetical protein